MASEIWIFTTFVSGFLLLASIGYIIILKVMDDRKPILQYAGLPSIPAMETIKTNQYAELRECVLEQKPISQSEILDGLKTSWR